MDPWCSLVVDTCLAIGLLSGAPDPDPDPDPSPGARDQRALIERDWMRQDGIGHPRSPATWAEAIDVLVRRGDALVEDIEARGVDAGGLVGEWKQRREEREGPTDEVWWRLHWLRRRLLLRAADGNLGPLLFAKQVPGSFSHQLTQYYGRCARPGGGLHVLEEPGRSMRTRCLTAGMPRGSFQHPEVSWDGRRVLFAFCRIEGPPGDWRTSERVYDLWELDVEGGAPRRITQGPYDDFSPRYLPGGGILFVSTRRGGFHRCGRGPCPVYTLAAIGPGGGEPRVLSWHETHEWDPAVLGDGRVVYTRWDYVDRHAVHYQQLWVTRPDGTGAAIFYGNGTFNPVGIWEARPVPGGRSVIATAAAHHAMTAGSIILVDPARGVDGPEPITRLTPDVRFPESEAPVGHWHAPVGAPEPPPVPPEESRWPGHCYRSPYPISDGLFLAAYSYEPLIGEPHANPPNAFGIYLLDHHGNKELLYRDPEISSLWPVPLRPRPVPPELPSRVASGAPREGTFFVENVGESWPYLPAGDGDRIRGLRILQVLPKTTPHANQPRVGLANASPGKQVLGTVPVEPDGSAWFRAPAGVPLAFQALDARGRAVQTMRSLVYLQPGENASCVGCHEPRDGAPTARAVALALRRGPSAITPGPDGSRPLSYPLLVQPVLDRHCVGCHAPDTDGGPGGDIVLTGEPEGEFTRSYLALAPRVPFAAWTGGDFRKTNSEPYTHPDRFGARASKLLALLTGGHHDVRLTGKELERLITWMDANALFYGTFDPEDQARQRRGERIAGPALE